RSWITPLLHLARAVAQIPTRGRFGPGHIYARSNLDGEEQLPPRVRRYLHLRFFTRTFHNEDCICAPGLRESTVCWTKRRRLSVRTSIPVTHPAHSGAHGYVGAVH